MRLSPSDLRALTVFRALGEGQGFLGAQITLGMSQSTISFHLKALEERVGFQLCHRGRRGFQLTDRGREIFRLSEPLVGAIATFERRLGALRHEVSGTLRIGVVDNTVTDPGLPLHEAIAACHRAAPEAEIMLSIAAPESLVVDISHNRLDVAIGPRLNVIGGIRQVALYEETHALFCGRGHKLFTAPATLSAAQVQAHDFVIRAYADRRELLHFPLAHASAHASNMEAQARFILSGAYLGYLPEHFAERWVERGDMRKLLWPATQIQSPFVILTSKEHEATPLQKIFLREIMRPARAARRTAGA